jgi:hypothetical protein
MLKSLALPRVNGSASVRFSLRPCRRVMVFAEEIDVGEVKHVRRAGIEFVESILGWKGRIEELSNNSPEYQAFDG